jgi:hypothetical protein
VIKLSASVECQRLPSPKHAWGAPEALLPRTPAGVWSNPPHDCLIGTISLVHSTSESGGAMNSSEHYKSTGPVANPPKIRLLVSGSALCRSGLNVFAGSPMLDFLRLVNGFASSRAAGLQLRLS